MSEDQWLPLVQSYLARPDRDLATIDECAAWEQFHLMCRTVILASIRRVRAARAVSEDVSQDVLTKLVENLPDFNLDPARGDLESWVKSIASHEAWRWVRKRCKRHEGPLDADMADHVLDPDPGPDVELERMQQHELFKARVTEFAERLRERDRRIVIMRFVNLRSVLEIIRELGLTEGCAWSVLHRAVPQLRDFLRACGLGAP
jgi:RNA polymerase sigma factor (sigma-70 family)